MYECTEYLDPIYTLQGCISSIMFYDSEISHLVKVTESTAQETRTTFIIEYQLHFSSCSFAI